MLSRAIKVVSFIEISFYIMYCYVDYFRASSVGNVEALVKLAVAYLYNEGCK